MYNCSLISTAQRLGMFSIHDTDEQKKDFLLQLSQKNFHVFSLLREVDMLVNYLESGKKLF